MDLSWEASLSAEGAEAAAGKETVGRPAAVASTGPGGALGKAKRAEAEDGAASVLIKGVCSARPQCADFGGF